jgi:hypothetical protein
MKLANDSGAMTRYLTLCRVNQLGLELRGLDPMQTIVGIDIKEQRYIERVNDGHCVQSMVYESKEGK